MSTPFGYHFDWDPAKAETNRRKHGVSFEQATTVFLDRLALTVPDERHSETKQRWFTLGQARDGRLLAVAHTIETLADHAVQIRLISARPATRRERRQYENEPR